MADPRTLVGRYTEVLTHRLGLIWFVTDDGDIVYRHSAVTLVIHNRPAQSPETLCIYLGVPRVRWPDEVADAAVARVNVDAKFVQATVEEERAVLAVAMPLAAPESMPTPDILAVTIPVASGALVRAARHLLQIANSSAGSDG